MQERRLLLKHFPGWLHHRWSWDRTLEELDSSLGSPDGVPCIGAVEDLFMHGNEFPNSKWIGFLHLCPNIPDYFERIYNRKPLDLNEIFSNEVFSNALNNCLGLFVLSNTLKTWVEERFSGTVNMLYLPTVIPSELFSMDKYLASDRKMLFLGGWLRRLRAFSELPVSVPKIWLKGDVPVTANEWLSNEGTNDLGGIQEYPYLDSPTFDQHMSSSTVFLFLYGSSANNAIVDCLARGTPLLVNRLPAVVEYLGDDYPLFYSSLTEAAAKIENVDLIEEAHKHMLANPVRQELPVETFVERFAASSIYRALQ